MDEYSLLVIFGLWAVQSLSCWQVSRLIMRRINIQQCLWSYMKKCRFQIHFLMSLSLSSRDVSWRIWIWRKRVSKGELLPKNFWLIHGLINILIVTYFMRLVYLMITWLKQRRSLMLMSEDWKRILGILEQLNQKVMMVYLRQPVVSESSSCRILVHALHIRRTWRYCNLRSRHQLSLKLCLISHRRRRGISTNDYGSILSIHQRREKLMRNSILQL